MRAPPYFNDTRMRWMSGSGAWRGTPLMFQKVIYIRELAKKKISI
jgi:hypothetical protein